MTTRENESIAAKPRRVSRIMVHDLLKQQVRRRRESHGSARMTIARVLDGIGSQGAQIPHRIVIAGVPGQGRERLNRHETTLANRGGLTAPPRVDRLTI